MNGGPEVEETVTVAYIMDCLTITVHVGKCYKALIDSGSAILLIRYSSTTVSRLQFSLQLLN